MGAEPWVYFVPYQVDINLALKKLRTEVFNKGNYRGSELKPTTIKEAVDNMDADGTASILDIDDISTELMPGKAMLLEQDAVLDLFETDEPTHAMIEENEDSIFCLIDRGECICIVVYKDGIPDEIYFAGYSFD